MATSKKAPVEPDDSVTDAEEYDLDWLGDTETPSEMGDPQMIALYGQPGCGKGHPYGTPILTDTGWVPVEALEVGDTCIGSDGGVYRIFGVYDRGVLPVYEVTLSDGSSVQVDADHLWAVTTKKGGERVISTQQIIDGWALYSKYHLKVPPAPACDLRENPYLPLPPYALGALLADGCLHGGSIQWTKNSQAVADAMNASLAQAGYSLREITRETSTARQWKIEHPLNGPHWSVIKRTIQEMELNVPSVSKFIPSAYLSASIEQRTALLNGLFDGDGSVDHRGNPKYTTTSKRLAKDVLALCWSLGIAAHLQRKKGEGTIAVTIQSDHNPFLASRYRDAFTPHISDRVARRIVSIEPKGCAEVRCIAVTAPDSLYVTKDYIVTHNTYLAASISEVEGYYPVLIIDTEGSTVGTLASFRDDRITIKRVGTVAEFDKMIVSILTKPHPFKTVIVDTFGNALDRKEAQIFANLPKSKGGEDDGYAGWRILAVYAKKIIDGLREAPFKVVILFHEKEETTSLGKRISRVWINGSSKSYLPAKPDLFGLLRCETDDRAGTETRTLFLGNDTNRATKTRFTQLGLPLTIKNPTMAGIIGTIREHDKKEN